jgi:L-glyceraldehyde 3-phosphate reductase
LEDTLSAINNLAFSQEELKAIDEFAVESDINLWAQSRS